MADGLRRNNKTVPITPITKTIPMQLMAKIANALSSAETLLHVFEWLSIGAGVLTVAALIGIALTSRIVSHQNKMAFAHVEKDVAEAKTRQAEAETKLEEVRKRQEPRRFDINKFTEALGGKPKCEVEILYQPNDKESYDLGILIFLMLISADWSVNPQGVTPIPADMGTKIPTIVDDKGVPIDLGPRGREMFKQSLESLPPIVRAGAPGGNSPPASGVFIAANKTILPPFDINTAYGALANAFIVAGLTPDNALVENLPDNKLRIIIGSKP